MAEAQLGKFEGETQELHGHPITKEEAAAIQAEEAAAGHDTGKGSYAARARSAASVNVREERVPQSALGGVAPFHEEPYTTELREHGHEIGGKQDEKRDILGKLITHEDASKIHKMETRLGNETGTGTLASRVASAASANVKEGRVASEDSSAGTANAAAMIKSLDSGA
eukprot:SM000058S18539  [mRNA]  locus=s58:482036:483173:+ [translate_table: standard]